MGSRRNLRAAWLPLAFAATVVGCNDGPFKMVRVSGSVKFADGRPVSTEPYRMKFVPIEVNESGEAHPRGATVKVDADGEFSVATTLTYDDGIIAGKHRVYLPQSVAAYVPPEYADPSRSPLQIDTSDGKRFDLVIPNAN